MKIPRQMALALALTLAPGIAFATGGITGTSHDFVGTGTAPTAGLCTYCHTPHKAQSTRLLWNHTMSANTFSWTDASTTTGGTNLPSIAPAYSGASVRCLSCHDGTVAIGDVSWFGEGKPAPLSNQMLTGEFQITSGTTASDLKGNHPIAVPYPYGDAANTYNGITTGAGVALTEFKADPTASGIRLFTDTGSGMVGGATALKTGIECSSCHDPHNGATATGDLFLRGNMTGSDSNYICNKCHTK